MSEYTEHPAYEAVHARFPGVKLDGGGMTPMQGRLVFHQERLFRSTGSGLHAHRTYQEEAVRDGLPTLITKLTDGQCARALELIERACRLEGMHLFRDVNTGWRDLKA